MTCSIIPLFGKQCHNESLGMRMQPVFTASVGLFAIIGSIIVLLAGLFGRRI